MLKRNKILATCYQICAYLAKQSQDKFINYKEVARHIGISVGSMSSPCACLVRAGILDSRKGNGGGIRLKADPESISCLDIYQACYGDELEVYTDDGVGEMIEWLDDQNKQGLTMWSVKRISEKINKDS